MDALSAPASSKVSMLTMLFGLCRNLLKARLILALEDEARLVFVCPLSFPRGVGVVSRESLPPQLLPPYGLGDSAPLRPSESVLSEPDKARFCSDKPTVDELALLLPADLPRLRDLWDSSEFWSISW